ncbi:NADH-quinone oxidoreductase subunit NuoN [Cohnella sp. CFH 77786]|uniref:NADH-quinone oxidoreductase subunit N n=1 Tax=Cohnella sp. CFH 77786 TaxID=2662265 RepID=UPI001C60C192|nr:NADH-quinone oxidoreductase subunit N [Cohnella sp. CFH 77786]MBW5445916.1 NADH-quinone oxidoreductase subunit NuoN [Cohnella sp. CFH 77786]
MIHLPTLTWSDAWYLAPELTLSIFAVVLAVLDLFLPRSWNRNIIGWLTLVGLASAAAFVVWLMIDFKNAAAAHPEDPTAAFRNLLGGSYRIDDFGNLLKLVFLGASGFIVLSSLGSVRSSDIPLKGEFYYFMLPAALGAMVMSSSGDLITLFVGLELLSITSYILVGMRKRSGLSAEGAFKYLVAGGVASAFVLYGMSFLYGVTGTTNLAFIGEGIPAAITDYRALVYVAFFLMTAGFAMKLALAPFHAWAADVYQGAPTPVTSFLAVVSKGAAFAMLYRIFMNTAFFAKDDPFVQKDLYLGLSVLAAAAMIVGTAGALRQRQVKRLLALSGVANAGILLTPLAIHLTPLHSSLFSEFVYYLIAYAFMNIGAFAVLTVVSRGSGNESLSGFAGLYYRAPWTAAGMTVLLCSLSGLPVTGGFFGKLFILFGTVQTGAYWLAAILLVTTVVSYAVYFSFIRQMYMRSGSDDSSIRIPGPAGVTIWLCVAATLALGFLPKPVLGWIDALFSIPADFLAR